MIIVTVNYNRIDKKYSLPYHTVTVIGIRFYGNGNGNKRSKAMQKRNGNRKMAKVPTLVSTKALARAIEDFLSTQALHKAVQSRLKVLFSNV